MAIYKGENNSVLLKGDRNVAELYKGSTKLFGYCEPVSGESLVIEDAHRVGHKMKCSVRSKNMIPYPYKETSKTYNGITFTDNGDGGITVDGTATTNSMFYLTKPTNNNADNIGYLFEDGETYTINGNTNDSYVVVLHATNIETGGNIYYGGSFKHTFTVNKSKYAYNHIRIQVYKGVTVSEKTIYPMIEKGSAETDYTPYISDISAVAVKRLGKNLNDYYKTDLTADEVTSGGITFTVNSDKSVTVNGTASYTLHTAIAKVYLKKGQTYTISGCPAGGSVGGYCIYTADAFTDGTSSVFYYDTGKGKTFKALVEGYHNFRFLIEKGTTIENLTFYPQLELGSAVTDYEPYITPQTVTAASDGTIDGITSLSTYMTLISDVEGAVIDCAYLKS